MPYLWLQILRQKKMLRSEIEDWAMAHTHLETLCAKAGFTPEEIQPSGDCEHKDMIELADLLYKRIEELEAKLKKP